MLALSDDKPLKVFKPRNAQETVQGWALHATRRRDIHELEARRLDWFRYFLGTTATCQAAIAGTPAFAAWQSTSRSTAAGIITAAIGVGAAVLGSVMTFLDLGARAEAHRRAATAYKGAMREFEAARGTSGPNAESSADYVLPKLLPLLTEADRNARTVPRRLAAKIEGRSFRFVSTAAELDPNPTSSADALHKTATPRLAIGERPPSGPCPE